MLSTLSQALTPSHSLLRDESDWSDDSRPSTASSASGSASSVDSPSPQVAFPGPQSWAHVPASQASAELLGAVFEKHHSSSRLGLCFVQDEILSNVDMQEHTLDGVRYHTSSAIDFGDACDSVCPTTPLTASILTPDRLFSLLLLLI